MQQALRHRGGAPEAAAPHPDAEEEGAERRAPPTCSRVSSLASSHLREVFNSRLAVSILCAAVGIMLFGSLRVSEQSCVQSIVRAFESGTIAGFPESECVFHHSDEYVQRPAVHANLIDLLHPPSKWDKRFALIVGAKGTGKSTELMHAVYALRKEPGGAGVVYLLIRVHVRAFGGDLAAATRFEPPVAWGDYFSRAWAANPGSAVEPASAWESVEPWLLKAAKAYKTKHGRPAVLVLDAADFIAKADPPLFMKLLEFAKAASDAGTLRVVFGSSEGHVLPLLEKVSARSRALKPYEIGDLSDADAVKFVVKRGVPPDQARELVSTVAGGRFSTLGSLAESVKGGDTVPTIRAEMWTRTQSRLSYLGLLPAAGHPLFLALVQSSRLNHVSAVSLLEAGGLSHEAAWAMLDKLLETNILAVHPDGTVTAHDRFVQTYLTSEIPQEPAGL